MSPLTILDALVVFIANKAGVSESFIRFGIIGALGFVWDTSTVYALRHFTNLYIAGTCGFLVAASLNWVLHRVWTFRHVQHGAAHVQWAKFLLANVLGFSFNRGTFFVLVAFVPLVVRHPVLGTAAGACVGLGFNYVLSKRFVFR